MIEIIIEIALGWVDDIMGTRETMLWVMIYVIS